MSIVLPTEKTPPVQDISCFSILIHGMPKIGKSTFCAQMPDALFLATEPGLNSLNAYQIPIKTWEDFRNVYSLLRTPEGKKFKTVIIDTVDIAYRLCTQKVCSEYGINHISDFKAYGKGYNLVNKAFSDLLTSFAQLPQGLVLISHSQETEVESRTGKHKKVIPTLPGKAREIVTGLADIILYFDGKNVKDDNGNELFKRIIRTNFDMFYEAGDRTEALPPEIDMDFKIFETVFKEGLKKKGERKPGKPSLENIVKEACSAIFVIADKDKESARKLLWAYSWLAGHENVKTPKDLTPEIAIKVLEKILEIKKEKGTLTTKEMLLFKLKETKNEINENFLAEFKKEEK